MRRVHFDWLEAGEHTQKTVALLSRQLRRFLDDRAWLESRRIMEIVHQIETGALAVRDDQPTGAFMDLDAIGADMDLPLERPLYSPPLKSDHGVTVVSGEGQDVATDVLYDQILVDRARLEDRLESTLANRSQVTLARLIEEHPLEHGLAELVVWFSVATSHPGTVFDEETVDPIRWTDGLGLQKMARLSRIILSGNGEGHGR